MAVFSRVVAKRPSLEGVQREVGARVRAARTAAKLTQEQTADRAGIDVKRLQRVEAGTVNVTVRTLFRIAEAIGTDFWSLLGSPRD